MSLLRERSDGKGQGIRRDRDMAAEVRADCWKVVSMGMGVLMKIIGLQPGNGKGAERLVLENRQNQAKNESG